MSNFFNNLWRTIIAPPTLATISMAGLFMLQGVPGWSNFMFGVVCFFLIAQFLSAALALFQIAPVIFSNPAPETDEFIRRVDVLRALVSSMTNASLVTTVINDLAQVTLLLLAGLHGLAAVKVLVAIGVHAMVFRGVRDWRRLVKSIEPISEIDGPVDANGIVNLELSDMITHQCGDAWEDD
jgi:hypothetical protein